jgi:hypothetical protein
MNENSWLMMRAARVTGSSRNSILQNNNHVVNNNISHKQTRQNLRSQTSQSDAPIPENDSFILILIHINSPEGIMVRVIGGLKLDIHQVQGCIACRNEKDLHRCIVQAHKVGEKVQIPGRVREGEQDL